MRFDPLGLAGIAVIIVVLVGIWKTFEKAGQPGWGAIIPIYNAYLMCKIAGQSGWLTILLFIPLINVFVYFYVVMKVAENFGKGIGFTIGLFLLPYVFFPILGFGDAKYSAKS